MIRTPGGMFVALLGFVASSVAAAPEPAMEEFDDRNEGTRAEHRITPGEKISMFAARIESSEEESDGESPFRIALWLPDSASVAVLVRNFPTRYEMEPKQRELPAGVWQFSWPPEIAGRHGLGMAELFPLALHQPRVRRVVYPALVFRERPVVSELRYVFSFWARVPVTLLDWEFRQRETAETVDEGSLRGVPADKPFDVVWEPKTADGQPLDPGIYDLFLRTTFQPQPGTPGRKLVQKYRFHHVPEFPDSLGAGK